MGAALLQRHDDMLRALWQRRGPEARLVVIVEGKEEGAIKYVDTLARMENFQRFMEVEPGAGRST